MRRSESDIHQQAKIALAQHLRAKKQASVVLPCSLCGTFPYPEDPDSEDIYDVVPDFDAVEVEYLLPINRRADVVLLKDDVPVFLIEVRRMNPVNNPKKEQLNGLGVPWIELTAADIIGAEHIDPVWWVERAFLGLRQLCFVCGTKRKS